MCLAPIGTRRSLSQPTRFALGRPLSIACQGTAGCTVADGGSERPFDAVTFASGATARNFVELAGGPQAAQQLCANAVIAVIGPVTAEATQAVGLTPRVVAAEATLASLVDALEDHYTAG